MTSPAGRSISEPRAASQPDPTPAAPRFAVVVPTLNEATQVVDVVRHLDAFPAVVEVIIADGGSHDGTPLLARAAGARVVHCQTGRGLQMNAGARAATADHLLFLHADCRLPRDAFDAIRRVYARGHEAGVFAIDYGSRHPLLCLSSRLSHLHASWTEFGEAALFVRRDCFERLGGFRNWPFLEDVEFFDRLRRTGRFGKAHATVQASPRRFARRGAWRQQTRNLLCLGLFRLGVSPARLARFYGALETSAAASTD